MHHTVQGYFFIKNMMEMVNKMIEFLIEMFKAFILGFVEGMTEFAPVSSTGHMIIFDDLWLQTKEFLGSASANTFKIVIQLGSILAVILVMWKRIFNILGLY